MFATARILDGNYSKNLLRVKTLPDSKVLVLAIKLYHSTYKNESEQFLSDTNIEFVRLLLLYCNWLKFDELSWISYGRLIINTQPNLNI